MHERTHQRPAWVRALACAWLAAGAWLNAAAQTATAPCPPQAQMPTPPQLEAARAAARDRGFLWRISRDGRDAYLYGTLHLGNLEWALPGPALNAALQATDTLALEVDMANPEVQAQIPAAMAALGPGPQLPAALRARIERQVAAACLPAGALAALHPAMQLITLSALAARWDGLDPAFGQDIVLAGMARAQQRPVLQLENLAQQLALLVPGDAQQALKMVQEQLEGLEGPQLRDGLRRLARVWEQGDLAALEDYESWCECARNDEERAFMRRLNDERNPAMAERISAWHGEGKRLLVAVGALHMSGPQGLPKLLRERGFEVQRVGR